MSAAATPTESPSPAFPVGEILAALRGIAKIPPEERLLSVSDIAEYLGIAQSTTYGKIVCQPDFPTPIAIRGGQKRWVAAEVIAWTKRNREPSRSRR